MVAFFYYIIFAMKKLLIIIFCLFMALPAISHDEIEGLVLDATITKNEIKGDVAVYNLSNGKMHTPDCEWAQKCTKNCIYLNKNDIKRMFYVPCLVCGGGVIEPLSPDDAEE